MNTDYRRRLPHKQPNAAIIFVTFRTKNSIPKAIINQIQQRHHANQKAIQTGLITQQQAHIEDKKIFAAYDTALDSSPTDTLNPFSQLHKPQYAHHLMKTIQNGTTLGHYILHRYCIMPNHAHILIEPLPPHLPETFQPNPTFPSASQTLLKATWRAPDNPDHQFRPLQDIMKSIKGIASRHINQTANRTGALFQAESFDHYVRDQDSYYRIIQYIDNNPVKARLTNDPKNWPWHGP